MKKTLIALSLVVALGSLSAVQAQSAPPADQQMDHSAMNNSTMGQPDKMAGHTKAAPVAIALNDAQIAHIAYTAGTIDITAAKQALAKSHNPDVIAFAKVMARDHAAVNDQALALAKKLGVTPENNPISQELLRGAQAEQDKLSSLTGAAFDKAYADNEVAYHKTVLSALDGTLIPDTKNAELKSLLQTGSKLFHEHEMHAEHLAASLK